MMRFRWCTIVILAAASACNDTTAPLGPDARVVAVAAGDQFTCGLVRDGRVFCWGLGERGQLGNDSVHAVATPTAVASDQRFAAVSAAGQAVCAVTAQGEAWCWGDNGYGQLGVAEAACHPVMHAYTCARVPARVAGVPPLSAVAVGARTTCGVGGGRLWCWGLYGSLAGVTGTQAAIDAPVGIVDSATYAAVTVGVYHACGRTQRGALRCWGANWGGQLGAGTPGSSEPVPIASAPDNRWTAVSAAGDHTCGVDSAGTGRCWGFHYYGALGLDTLENTAVPTAVSPTLRFTTISTSPTHTCAVTDGGAVYCWGSNAYGELGVTGTPVCFSITCSTVPVLVSGAPADVVGVSAGTSHTCAVTAAGEAWCWGRGTAGQLGDGGFTTRTPPARVVIPEDRP